MNFSTPSNSGINTKSLTAPSSQSNQMSSPFEIHSFEDILANVPEKLSESSRLTRFEILWIKSGKGSLTIDVNDIEFDGNVIFCLLPGQLRNLKSNAKMEGYYISLCTEFLCLPESQIDFSFLIAQHNRGNNFTMLHPDEETMTEMDEIVLKMNREFQNAYHMRSEILQGFLKIFMIYLSRKMESFVSGSMCCKDAEMVSRFMLLLKKEFANKKKVAEYADELCVTPNYLNQMVKRISGFSASYHIQQQIIIEAKRLAIYSGMRLKEIADFLGFDDYAHFSKFFKNYSGSNFSSFKKASAR
jgi:AraC family transcriptional regulator, transcriptional activator of pobA